MHTVQLKAIWPKGALIRVKWSINYPPDYALLHSEHAIVMSKDYPGPWCASHENIPDHTYISLEVMHLDALVPGVTMCSIYVDDKLYIPPAHVPCNPYMHRNDFGVCTASIVVESRHDA